MLFYLEEIKMPKYDLVLKVNLKSPDGNAYEIITNTIKLLKAKNVPIHIINEYKKQAFSGDFANVLTVTGEWLKLKIVD